MIIGIEGPAGSGKSTMARTVAVEMGAVLLEGGSWYRALTYLALRDGIDMEDTDPLVALAKQMQLSLKPDADGTMHLFLEGEDITPLLYTDQVATQIPIISKQLPVREIVEGSIVEAARSYDKVILVGRHIHKALPEAAVLRVNIDDEEAERRHGARSTGVDQSVSGRNKDDAAIAAILGDSTDGVTEVDVTNLSADEQAEALRQFIRQSFPKA